jgi:hypothetical protein
MGTCVLGCLREARQNARIHRRKERANSCIRKISSENRELSFASRCERVGEFGSVFEKVNFEF